MVFVKRQIRIAAAALLLYPFSARPALPATYVVEPLLVAQPAYEAMTFHVFRPYNTPPGWYVTFDGYPVTQTSNGVWVYGSYDGKSLTPTNYVVGSIAPQTLSLAPYVTLAEISGFQTLPIKALRGRGGALALPAPSPTEEAVPPERATPPPPPWMSDGDFLAIASWQSLVDRMGLLDRPHVPVAWKGDSPSILFVWTGKGWYKIPVPSEDLRLTPDRLLRRHLYTVTRLVHENDSAWLEWDETLLSDQATRWGYLWMGKIVPMR